MKKIIIRIALVVVILLVVAVVAVFLSLNSIVKKGVETVGPQLTQVKITLGSANISPLSGSGQLSDLFVGNPEGFKTPSAIKLGDIKVAVDVGSVLTDTITVNSVKITAPEITFEGGLGGNNISKILDNVTAATASDKPATKTDTKEPATKSAGKKFIVKDLVIEGAKLHVSLTGLGGKEMTLPLPPLHLTDIGTKSNGVTAGELVKQTLTPLLASVTDVVKSGITNIGKGVGNVGKEAGSQVNKAAEGLKGLFKK
ncbi:MAG: hypothetical protein NTZ16_06155 [Verrucomicrobia bacterium]|nr:hypothetical protein [Verrucomicrobiota bacterium]